MVAPVIAIVIAPVVAAPIPMGPGVSMELLIPVPAMRIVVGPSPETIESRSLLIEEPISWPCIGARMPVLISRPLVIAPPLGSISVSPLIGMRRNRERQCKTR